MLLSSKMKCLSKITLIYPGINFFELLINVALSLKRVIDRYRRQGALVEDEDLFAGVDGS